MQFEEFEKQPKGPALFDVWLRTTPVRTSIGDLPVELHTSMDVPPTEEMIQAATALVRWTEANASYIADLVCGHYRFYESKNWLKFWGVPARLSTVKILYQVDTISLTVDEDCLSGVFVDPKWDPEHKLTFTYRDGSIVEANDSPFRLENGILYAA